MKIIKIVSTQKSNILAIRWNPNNVCNYHCEYCWPGSNSGTMKFPDVDVAIKNISFLLDYYKEHTNKTKFDLTLLGGEPTHWPHFIKFVKYFKENYNCIITLKTNGSKQLNWWEQAAPYLDDVGISIHHEFVDIEHARNLADFLYTKRVSVSTQVMMDPFVWDKCIQNMEYLKGSQYKWPIRFSELIDVNITYTAEQRTMIDSVRVRGNNWLRFLLNNRSHRTKTTVVYENGTTKSVPENHLLVTRQNVFTGWECNLGVDWVCISADGALIGFCPNTIYDQQYNVYDNNFKEIFSPEIKPVKCEQSECVCVFDTFMPKKRINKNTKKIIPIKEIK
jgi:MoaA/NifB/PqqE/SkfB family radical SAM enzyme